MMQRGGNDQAPVAKTLGASASWRYITLRVLVGAILAVLSQSIVAMPPSEELRVERLLVRVARSEPAVFIRNGTEYSAADAARFLRRKCNWRLAGYAAAEDFVSSCATASSTSGQPYRIRLPGETLARPSAEVLATWLADIPK